MTKTEAQQRIDNAARTINNRNNVEFEGQGREHLMHIEENAISMVADAGFAVVGGTVYSRTDFDAARTAFNGVIIAAGKVMLTGREQGELVRKAERAAGVKSSVIKSMKAFFTV